MMARVALLLCIALLPIVACERRPHVAEDGSAQVAPGYERIVAIRQAAAEVPSAIDVMPLRDPAVDELLTAAYRLEDAVRYRDAGVALRQAYALQPDSPEVQQRMAENAYFLGDFEQAESRALTAWRRGARVGGLCLRHWLLVAEARAAMGNVQGETEAREQAQQCAQQRPARF
ncbi:MAG TPA: tetratricopeptide repeat protein [Xanthomonadaceae bacterium]|nr:tetratricopeptide repeat protein [Xanthomonadaceae bacterium]